MDLYICFISVSYDRILKNFVYTFKYCATFYVVQLQYKINKIENNRT